MIATVLCTSLSTECKSSSLTRSPLFSLLRLALEQHRKPFTVNVMRGLTCTPGHVVTLTNSHTRGLMEHNEIWSLADDDYFV